MAQLKPLKFTICYRKTTFIYVSSSFTEENFVNQLSAEGKERWAALTPEKRKAVWLKLKKDFPFELGGEPLDPHNNWIESWDEEENEESEVPWTTHNYIKEEITDTVTEIVSKELTASAGNTDTGSK